MFHVRCDFPLCAVDQSKLLLLSLRVIRSHLKKFNYESDKRRKRVIAKRERLSRSRKNEEST